MLVRRIKCGNCGAPLDRLPESELLMCEYCGSFLGLDTERVFSPEAMLEAHEKTQAQFVAPSRLQARSMQLAAAMEQAKREQDRRAYAVLAREQAALSVALRPDRYPTDPAALRVRVTQMAKMLELLTFDENLVQAQAAVGDATGDLAHAAGERALAAAERLVAEQEALYRLLFNHPDYPADGSENIELAAREAARATVESLASSLPPGTAALILERVFGLSREQEPQFACANCGAILDRDDIRRTSRCPYCGSVVRVRVEDPWRTQLKGIWAVASRSTPRKDHAMAAIQVLLTSYYATGDLPELDRMREFLEAAVPYLSKEELEGALLLLASGYENSDKRLSGHLRNLAAGLADWRPKGQAPSLGPDPRPVEPEDTEREQSNGDLSEDPWVIQTLALWSMTKATVASRDIEAALLSMALDPFGLGGRISVAQALEFFRQAEPHYSKERLKRQVELHLMAREDKGAMHRFLEALGEALS